MVPGAWDYGRLFERSVVDEGALVKTTPVKGKGQFILAQLYHPFGVFDALSRVSTCIKYSLVVM